MLKRRIIPKLQLKMRMIGKQSKIVLVTSVNFREYIDIGDPISQAKIYQDQAADELIFVDTDSSLGTKVSDLISLVSSTAKEIFMPFTVGGGVRSITDFRSLLLNGADKICINTAAVENKNLICEASNLFGRQCVVVSIDFKKSDNGTFKVYTNCGKKQTNLDPIEWAKEVEERGAGEILLTSIDRDGTRSGLELELIANIADAVRIPVIASGGCGMASHFVDGFIRTNASAISAGTYFCFKDENLMQVRSQVKNAGIPIRLHI